jgi:hypothetical protein
VQTRVDAASPGTTRVQARLSSASPLSKTTVGDPSPVHSMNSFRPPPMSKVSAK